MKIAYTCVVLLAVIDLVVRSKRVSKAWRGVLFHRAIGGDPNDEEEFNEIYLSLAVNVGNGAGKEHPESYTDHPMGFSNDIVHSVADKIDTGSV
jgi:hypothetical protein